MRLKSGIFHLLCQSKNSMNILISGANSGLGKALAISYAGANINLFLCARNLQKLQEIKKICQDLKANVFIKSLDVKNEEECAAWIAKIEENYPLDLVIANAGISAGTSDGIESIGQIQNIFATNISGVLNIVNPAIAKMKQRQKGQIALISSLAGFRGLPSSPAYSASKAAVRVYGEGLRGNLADFGIKVSVVCPGYIKTPMTDVNKFYMPFLMEVEKAAKIIKKGIAKNKSRIAFPAPLYFVVWLAALLPVALTDKIFAKLPKKEAL